MDQSGFDALSVVRAALKGAASAIAEKAAGLFRDRILDGKVTPPLKPDGATIARKRALGYPKPEAPLYASGKMAKSLQLGEVRETPEGIEIDLVYDENSSPVNPNWHVNRVHTPPPKRNPLEGQESALAEMIQEALS